MNPQRYKLKVEKKKGVTKLSYIDINSYKQKFSILKWCYNLGPTTTDNIENEFP